MKTIIAALLMMFATVAVAEESYVVKYNSDIHGLVLYSGTSNDTSKWNKKVYLLNDKYEVVIEDVDPTIVKVLDQLK